MSDIKIFTDLVEPEAIDQIYTLGKQPAFKDCKIRIMPDVHAGKGCTIGFTANLGDKVIPNIVGVDIGCGMLTIQLGKCEIDFNKLDNVIRKYVPYGYDVHSGRVRKFPRLQELYCYRNLKDTKRLERSIGTLGGGNHFIEIDENVNGDKFLIIHTGSRNLGKQVCEYYQALAVDLMQGKDELFKKQKELIEEYKRTGRRNEIESAIKELHRTFKPNKLGIPKELAYLEGEYREQYLHDMKICQDYALLNRITIGEIICSKVFGQELYTLNGFETIHNYIDHETNIVRKGAISARKGEMLLIPINMKDGCIIGMGKGNDDWNCSAPHGAGRLMSRSKAKETLNLDEYKKSMDGIFTTCVNQSTIDEAPMVYKPIESIVDNIGDTVEIIDIIKPIYNFKASEG
jgi:RNA-splicing ligase RtcB